MKAAVYEHHYAHLVGCIRAVKGQLVAEKADGASEEDSHYLESLLKWRKKGETAEDSLVNLQHRLRDRIALIEDDETPAPGFDDRATPVRG